jgi:YesN/AraC family two-component response regulator
VDFITSNTDWGSLMLSPDIPWQAEILSRIQHIYTLSKEKPMDYELELHYSLEAIWHGLFRHYAALPEKEPQTAGHLERLKAILEFIHGNYAAPLTLENIADSVNICPSECCRFFKKHMKMTLFEYLMFYRIQQSLPLLKSEESITKVSGMVGFSNSCYYGKIFKRYMNCSPSQYRKGNVP